MPGDGAEFSKRPPGHRRSQKPQSLNIWRQIFQKRGKQKTLRNGHNSGKKRDKFELRTKIVPRELRPKHSGVAESLPRPHFVIHPWRIYPSYGHWDDHFDDGYIRHMTLNGLITGWCTFFDTFGNTCRITMCLRRTVSQSTHVDVLWSSTRDKRSSTSNSSSDQTPTWRRLWTSLHRLRVNTRLSLCPKTIVLDTIRKLSVSFSHRLRVNLGLRCFGWFFGYFSFSWRNFFKWPISKDEVQKEKQSWKIWRWRSPISLSSPRKSTMGKNVRSISFFGEEEVREKLRKQSLCLAKTLERKLCEQIQHCFPRIIFAETCNDALFADFAKRTHHSTVFFIIPAITGNVHGDCWLQHLDLASKSGLHTDCIRNIIHLYRTIRGDCLYLKWPICGIRPAGPLVLWGAIQQQLIAKKSHQKDLCVVL